MRLLLNVLWFIFGGWISGTLWIIAGCLLAITVVGLPWTPAAFRIAGFSYWPFGRIVIDRDDGIGSGCLNILWLVLAGWWLALHHVLLAVPRDAGFGSALLNVLWLVLAGWWLALHHVVLAVGLALTVIGIPFAWQHLKLAGLALMPVGKGVVEV